MARPPWLSEESLLQQVGSWVQRVLEVAFRTPEGLVQAVQRDTVSVAPGSAPVEASVGSGGGIRPWGVRVVPLGELRGGFELRVRDGRGRPLLLSQWPFQDCLLFLSVVGLACCTAAVHG